MDHCRQPEIKHKLISYTFSFGVYTWDCSLPTVSQVEPNNSTLKQVNSVLSPGKRDRRHRSG